MYDMIIIGSGISSMCFLDSLEIKNQKIALISYSSREEIVQKNGYEVKFLNQNLPPRFSVNNNKDLNSLKNYFFKNNINFDKNSSLFGVLNQGGVSNYWGSSCQFPSEDNLNFLNETNKKKLLESFTFLSKKYNFSGSFFSKLNLKKNNNLYSDHKLLNTVQNISNNQIKFYENDLAYDNISDLSFSPKNFGGKIFNKVENLNYFVKKISKEQEYYKIFCEDTFKKKEITLSSKKIVLAAGTLASTKLVSDMVNNEEKIELNHNPMLFGLFIFKKNIKEKSFLPSKIAAEIISDKSNFSSIANLRGSNDSIKEKIFGNYFFMKNYFSKSLYNLMENKFLFINLYLDSKSGCLSIKKGINSYNISVDLKKLDAIKKDLKHYYNIIYKVLRKENVIYPFKYHQIPKMGTDNHYTGTIPIRNSLNKLSLNENSELRNFSGFYIIDGSAIPKNNSKFPTCLIMANAYRVGKLI